jgi:hypothetical protein
MPPQGLHARRCLVPQRRNVYRALGSTSCRKIHTWHTQPPARSRSLGYGTPMVVGYNGSACRRGVWILCCLLRPSCTPGEPSSPSHVGISDLVPRSSATAISPSGISDLVSKHAISSTSSAGVSYLVSKTHASSSSSACIPCLVSETPSSTSEQSPSSNKAASLWLRLPHCRYGY